MICHIAVFATVLLLVVPTLSAPPNLLRPPPCSVKVPKLPLESLPVVTAAPETTVVDPPLKKAPGAPDSNPGNATTNIVVVPGGATDSPPEAGVSTVETDGPIDAQTHVPEARAARAAKNEIPDDSIVILTLDPNQAFGDPVPMTIRKANYNLLVDLRNAFCDDGMRGVALFLRDGPLTTPTPYMEPEEASTTPPPPLESESAVTTAPIILVEDSPSTLSPPPAGESLDHPDIPTGPEIQAPETHQAAPSKTEGGSGLKDSHAMDVQETMTVDSTPFSPLLMDSRLFGKSIHEGITFYFLRKLM